MVPGRAGPLARRAIVARLRGEGTESPVRTDDLPSMNRVLWPAELSRPGTDTGSKNRRPDFTTVPFGQPATTVTRLPGRQQRHFRRGQRSRDPARYRCTRASVNSGPTLCLVTSTR